MGIQKEKETQRALIYTESRQKLRELRYVWAETKAQGTSIYTGYYYDTYGIGPPW